MPTRVNLPLYRLDDLRRLGEAIGVAAGLKPARAALLASLRLWYDAAGIPDHGLAALPKELGGRFDPRAEGRVSAERTSVVDLDGGGGIPSLILARAAEIAVEKARESGVGLVRVSNIEVAGPSAAVVAEIAVGPAAGMVLGLSIALALPSANGLPVVFDSALGGETPEVLLPMTGPWRLLAPEGGLIVGALGVAGSVALAEMHARVSALLAGMGEAPGLILPEVWEARRRVARERGVAMVMNELRAAAEAIGVAVPAGR